MKLTIKRILIHMLIKYMIKKDLDTRQFVEIGPSFTEVGVEVIDYFAFL
jgi:hypothetical protein